MKQTVFADTAAWLALINKSDTLHKKAKKVRDGLLDHNSQFVVTDYVIVEIANSLSRIPLRESAVNLINSMTVSKNIEIVEIEPRRSLKTKPLLPPPMPRAGRFCKRLNPLHL